MAAKRSGIQLCYPFDETRLAKWKTPYIVQPKLDGDRCRAIFNNEGRVTLLSSECSVFISVPHIVEALQKMDMKNCELDGELYIHGAPHEDIHSIVSRKTSLHPDYKLMQYHVFDIITDQPQVVRTKQLSDLVPSRGTNRNFGTIQPVAVRLAEDIEDIMICLDDYINQGYEGLVVRESMAPYVRKRSTQVMKFKPRKEDIYEIVGTVEEISIEGYPKGSLGSIVCQGNDSTKFNVGSGSLFTRDKREKLWTIRDTLVGKYLHVKYQHMTSARGVPRFPIGVKIIDNPFL